MSEQEVKKPATGVRHPLPDRRPSQDTTSKRPASGSATRERHPLPDKRPPQDTTSERPASGSATRECHPLPDKTPPQPQCTTRKRPAPDSTPASKPSKVARYHKSESESAAEPKAPTDELEPLWSSLRDAISMLQHQEQGFHTDTDQAGLTEQAKEIYVLIANVVVKKEAVITASGRNGASFKDTTRLYAEQDIKEDPSHVIDRAMLLFKLIREDLKCKGIAVDEEAKSYLHQQAPALSLSSEQVVQAIGYLKNKDEPYDNIKDVDDFLNEFNLLMGGERHPALPEEKEDLARVLKGIYADVAQCNALKGHAKKMFFGIKNDGKAITLTDLRKNGKLAKEPAHFVRDRIRTCRSIRTKLEKLGGAQKAIDEAREYLRKSASVFRVSDEVKKASLEEIRKKFENSSSAA